MGLANIQVGYQKFPLDRNGESGKKMTRGLRGAILAKMANMANTRQSLGKNSNDMAKGRFESGDFDENGEYGKIYQSLNYVSHKMAKEPLKKWQC